MGLVAQARAKVEGREDIESSTSGKKKAQLMAQDWAKVKGGEVILIPLALRFLAPSSPGSEIFPCQLKFWNIIIKNDWRMWLKSACTKRFLKPV
jgi:hypothetical protein